MRLTQKEKDLLKVIKNEIDYAQETSSLKRTKETLEARIAESKLLLYDELYDAVLQDIRRRAKTAAEMDQQMLANLKREASGQLGKKLRDAEKAFKTIDSRITELDTIIGKLYEDSALARISAERFNTLLQKYETEQAELKKKHVEVKKEFIEQQKHQSENEQFMELIATYKDISLLNGSILNELIKSIHVSPIQRVDGVKHRSIRIQYRHFCYVEMFSQDELFGSWSEADRNAWKELESELAKREAESMAM